MEKVLLAAHLLSPPQPPKTDLPVVRLTKVVMRPPLDVYDVLIHLNPKQVPLLGQAVDPPTVNFSRGVIAGASVAESGGALPVVDFNPVALYLAELRVSPGSGAKDRFCRLNVILE